MMTHLRPLLVHILATMALTAKAFTPPIPVNHAKKNLFLPKASALFFQNGDEGPKLPPSSPILTTSDRKPEISIPPMIAPASSSTEPKKLVLSITSTVTDRSKNKEPVLSVWKAIRQRSQKWMKRPGSKFRVRLGVIITTAIAAISFFVPQRRILFSLARNWVSHRGFQGISALGRSVAYIWAALVAYPRMLDRRAVERRRNRYDKQLERRHAQLVRLAEEISRLRQELTSIDAEIRAFRREIISLNHCTKDDCNHDDVQKAIDEEMSHLTQIRSDTQMALSAARQTWADYRANSPPEVWEDDILLP